MNVLVIFDHPRRTSFSGAVLDAFVRGLTEAGHTAEIADLRTEGFDPRLGSADEPDWDDPKKTYSPDVLAEQARIERNEALAFIFPVWWWSLPATTKGWIDRVWNNGWAYGERKLPHSKALLLAVCGGHEELYAKRGYDIAMQTQLLTGIIDLAGSRRERSSVSTDRWIRRTCGNCSLTVQTRWAFRFEKRRFAVSTGFNLMSASGRSSSPVMDISRRQQLRGGRRQANYDALTVSATPKLHVPSVV